MFKSIIIAILLLPTISFAQFSFFGDTEPTGEPEMHYYKFYDGIQMIEFDYLTAYHKRVNYLEQAKPRALTWEMVLGPPHPNVYLFRNENGDIIKQYGNVDVSKLLTVEESKKIAESHNSLFAKLGSVVGFSQISTRYFPYYLIGSVSNNSESALGLIDSFGNVVLQPEYMVIWQHGDMFITRTDSINELRDKDLNIRFISNMYDLQPSYNHYGFADIRLNDRWGLMDATGKIVVPCKYNMLVDAFNEYGLAQVSNVNGIGYVDSTGEEVIKCKYQSVGEFREGLLDARYNDKWGYIDTKGNTIIPHKYDIGIWFEDGLARVAKREGSQYYFGYIDKEGNEVIPLIYSNAKDFENGVAEVMIDGKWVRIDKKGNRI